MSSSITAESATQTAAPAQSQPSYPYGSVSAAYKSSDSFFAGVAKAVAEAVLNVFRFIANTALAIVNYFKGPSQVDSSDAKSLPSDAKSVPSAEQELPDLQIVDAGAPEKAASKRFSKTTKVAVGLGTAAAALGVAHLLGYTQPADFVASGFNSMRNYFFSNPSYIPYVPYDGYVPQ